MKLPFITSISYQGNLVDHNFLQVEYRRSNELRRWELTNTGLNITYLLYPVAHVLLVNRLTESSLQRANRKLSNRFLQDLAVMRKLKVLWLGLGASLAFKCVSCNYFMLYREAVWDQKDPRPQEIDIIEDSGDTLRYFKLAEQPYWTLLFNQTSHYVGGALPSIEASIEDAEAPLEGEDEKEADAAAAAKEKSGGAEHEEETLLGSLIDIVAMVGGIFVQSAVMLTLTKMKHIDFKHNSSFQAALMHTARHDRFRMFYKGLVPLSIAKALIEQAADAVHESMEELEIAEDMAENRTLILSLTSVAFLSLFSLVAHPLYMIGLRVQCNTFGLNQTQNKNSLRALLHVKDVAGLRGLYQGYWPAFVAYSLMFGSQYFSKS